MTISEFGQERIAAAHIMVVGCGALGNEVLKHLALTGVGHIVVVDFDTVEADNLAHSVLFTADDAKAGRRKVDAVARRLRDMNPAADVTTIFGDVAYEVGLGLLREMDVVIGCVDNRLARYQINRLCMRAGIPWVDGGIDGLEGTARVFAPGENCYACNLGPEGLRDLAFRMPCAGTIHRNMAAGKVPTTSITASVIGAVEVQEALKLLELKGKEGWQGLTRTEGQAHGRLTSLMGRMFCYEGQHLSTRLVAFRGYDADCPVHEQWGPIVGTPLTTHHTVTEVLAWLGSHTGAEDVSFLLLNDCFVDEVVRRSDDARLRVMVPGRAVADAVLEGKGSATGGQGTVFSGELLSNLYQHEYREIDHAFPYQQLTLADLGIPDRDVLPFRAGSREGYFELSSL